MESMPKVSELNGEIRKRQQRRLQQRPERDARCHLRRVRKDMSSSLQARWIQAGVLQRLLPEAQACQTAQKILITSWVQIWVRVDQINPA